MLGGIFGRGRQQTEKPPAVPDEVAAAVVRADETMRRGRDELGYATAEFGEAATRDFASALTTANQHLQEAFRLNGLLLDEHPETPEEFQQLLSGLRAQTAQVDRLVRAEAGRFAARRAALREVPDAVRTLTAEIADVRSRVPAAEQVLVSLTGRYRGSAVRAVVGNAEQASALLEVAVRSLELAERRHGRGEGESSTKAVQVAADSIRRADELLEAVTAFEVEAVHAESTLGAVLADSRADASEARQGTQGVSDPQIEEATSRLEDEIRRAEAAAAEPGPADPFATLTALREANEQLEELRTERATRPDRERLRAQLETALDDADRQLALARSTVADHPGQVGPDARTRLAQAQRLLDGITAVEDPQQALAQARQAADLAAEASGLAQRDIATAAQQDRWMAENGGRGGWGQDEGWGGGWGGRRGPGVGGMGGVLGGVLGGMVLGGILDDIGDIDLD